MELTWKDIEDKLEQMDFHITSRDTNGELYQIEITKSLPYNSHEMSFTLQCDKDKPASVVDAFQELYDGYDVDYETSLWIGPDGHGTNGAPYHIRTILEGFEAIENDLKKSMCEIDSFIQNADRVYSVKEIGAGFLQTFADRNGENFKGDFIYATKSIVSEILSINSGTIQQKKDALNKYFTSIGIKPENPETYKNAITKALSKRKQNQTKEKKNNDYSRGV